MVSLRAMLVFAVTTPPPSQALPGFSPIRPNTSERTLSNEISMASFPSIPERFPDSITCPGSNRPVVIATNTGNRHVSNIFNKIGAGNRVEAATYAERHGLAS